MPQHDGNIANALFSDIRADINAALQALFTQHSGTERPSAAYDGQLWWDTDYSSNEWALYVHKGGVDSLIGILNTSANTFTASSGQSSPFSTGDIKATIKTTPDPGWVMLNDQSIGDASSGATGRANADCQALFTLIWNNISDTHAPIQDSGGTAVLRGASAAADWAAHRRIVLPKALGRVLGAAGAGEGLTSRQLGSTVGTETHKLTGAQSGLKAHGHTGSTSQAAGHVHQQSVVASVTFPGTPNIVAATAFDGDTSGTKTSIAPLANSGNQPLNTQIGGAHNHTVTVNNATASDADEAHPNMQPTLFVNWMIKL